MDLRPTQLIHWLRTEVFRDRDFKPRAHNASEQSNAAGAVDVKVLMSDSKSKKPNRSVVTEQARTCAAKLAESHRDSDILAVETTDAAMELIRCTTLSNPEGWRRAEQGVAPDTKRYIGQVRAELAAWKDKAKEEGAPPKHAFLYNFRTGAGFYYDLEA